MGINHSEFLYPRYQYQGQFKPNDMVFNANLQEFAQRVNYTCNLQTGGKLSPLEAYTRIESLWQELKHSKQELGIS